MIKICKQDVYDYITNIPRGKVTTYGAIAEHLGNKRWARAVGNILHKNPDCKKYPCYKVVNSQGKLSVNYAFGGIEKQRELLMQDGISVVNGKINLKNYMWSA